MPILFPEPVEPAIKICGMRAKSSTKTSPEIVFPKAIGNAKSASLYFVEFIKLRIVTICGLWFGISTPTVPLPGIGASILIPRACIASAKSLAKLVILEIFTPVAGTSSYKVTTGPGVTLTFSTSTPKSASFERKSSALAFNSSLEISSL